MRWVIFLFAVFSLFFAGMFSGQTSGGPHGGMMKKTNDHYIEMNHSESTFYAWLLDKKENSISNKNISCEVKFFFPDTTILGVKLSPFGEDGFSSEIAGDFYRCEITFQAMGKNISAKFDNLLPVVKEN